MRKAAGITVALIIKDLKLEFRSPRAFLTTGFFAVTTLVMFSFAFDPGDPGIRSALPGILWAALLFPGVIQLNNSFRTEQENDVFGGVLLTPVDRGVLFLGKCAANFILLFLTDLLVFAAFALIFNAPVDAGYIWLLLLFLPVNLAFSSAGTILAGMVSRLPSREVLLPVILFPVITPVLIIAVNATGEIFAGPAGDTLFSWLKMSTASGLLFCGAGYLLFEYIVED